MPNWLIIISTVLCASAIFGGLLFFPYVSMLFGVQSAEQHSFRGKLIVAVIILFIPVSIFSIYVAWTSNSYFALVPFAHFFVLYNLRANKNASAGPRNQFSSMAQNLAAKMEEIDYSWQHWTHLSNANNIVLLTFYASNETSALELKSKLSSTVNNYRSAELSAPYKNGSYTLEVEISLDPIEGDPIEGNPIERGAIEKLTKQLIELAWAAHCILNSLDIMEDSK